MSVKVFPAHKQCVNFKKGFCTAYNIVVNPDDPACPNFTPETTEPVQAIPRTPSAPYSPVVSPPQTFGNFSPFQPRSGRINWYGMSGRGGGQGRRRGGGRGGGRGGRGRGRMGGGFAAGLGGSCVCPNCGYTSPHVAGTPCYQQTCPKCGTKMTRKT